MTSRRAATVARVFFALLLVSPSTWGDDAGEGLSITGRVVGTVIDEYNGMTLPRAPIPPNDGFFGVALFIGGRSDGWICSAPFWRRTGGTSSSATSPTEPARMRRRG